MDELVQLVVKKAGIPEAAARTAVQTVVDYLKARLPGPVAGQVDAALKGGGGLGDLGKGLGGMLGKK